MKKCLIVANGKTPRKEDILFFFNRGFETLICADGGANSIRKLGLIPDFIIGDFDSIDKQTLSYYKDKCKIINIKRQNDTDVEKCLKFAIKNNFKEVVLFGVTGNRLDHTICNLGIVIKFYKKIKCCISAEKSFLVPINTTTEFKTLPNETISLYAFNDKTLITTKGLKFSIKNSSLTFGKKESTSNIAISNRVVIKIKNGVVFVIRDLETIKKYDLI